ncbi:EscC/YscC/HrcC family type III secretion system outer membrane ring protein [Burkholderia sp. Nafp2/4-1b]|uniref:EscC/YscC/HrcC family type III secretion system outer membrane ring protein n=1 Tax=Burkholderia sp. Nafp2/4-1b TaxID=2116686 RepID=UPI000EF96980|nr:EscC/YscC/HrcC family type III secretion system outer membrane ring protein [Burkholderia sp. Nafp2/4-1b]RKT98824.1 EscC/YscC/HrcC family type III secretion system outer membrane ring protein [Burkholderia sp. Nafp2/4-1b]
MMLLRRFKRARALASAVVATSVVFGPPTVAWPSSISTHGAEPFFFATRGTKLADMLHDLGANYRVPVIVSEQVNGAFIGTIDGGSPDATLDRLARLHRLAWYYDGQTLYVYRANEVSSRLIALDYLLSSTLIAQLDSAGLLDGRQCRVQAIEQANAVEVYGVPVCLERVAQFAKRLDQQAVNREQNQESVRLFPLKYATAADTSYSYRSQQVTVSGVASVLREMAQGRALPPKDSKGQSLATDGSLPMFAADERQNAVIVRDKRANMRLYGDLIAQLDRKPKLVEISVTIVDINAEDLGALGVDAHMSARIGGGAVSFNAGGERDTGGFSTVISNTGSFMVQLTALQQSSKARILSRPSIVTLDNMEAVLDRNITFYTKVSAERIAKLESISTGSLLRVTPRIVGDSGRQEVMLALVVQDGRQASPLSSQEPLPQTLGSEIATHSLLKEDEALLLGGFVQDELSEGERKIPLLGDLPILGSLFKTTRQSKRHTIRLFLIEASPWQQT